MKKPPEFSTRPGPALPKPREAMDRERSTAARPVEAAKVLVRRRRIERRRFMRVPVGEAVQFVPLAVPKRQAGSRVFPSFPAPGGALLQHFTGREYVFLNQTVEALKASKIVLSPPNSR